MTVHDMPRFESALRRLGRLEALHVDADVLRDWWSQLERYAIDVVVSALQDAPGERVRQSGSKKDDYKLTASLVVGICRKHAASQAHSRQTRYIAEGQATISAPGRRIDGATVTVVRAEYRCPLCEDCGWRAKVNATGELLTALELQARTNPHPSDGLERLSSADYRMSRCQCRRAA